MVAGSFFIWLLYPFGILPSLWIFFLVFPYFLTLQAAPGSPCISPSPAPESVISPRTTWCLSLCLHMPSCLIFPAALWREDHYPPSQVWIRKETLPWEWRLEPVSELTSACSTYTFATYMDLLYYKMEQSLHLSLGIHEVAGGGRTEKESWVESSRGKKELAEALLWWDFYVYGIFTQLSSSAVHHSNCPALMRSLCLQSRHTTYLSPPFSSPSTES